VLANALVRSFVPHLPNTTPGKGTSAPDTRAIANHIATWGTMMSDEWKPPKDVSHPFHRDQLQSLATGAGLVVGKVMDNVGHTVRPSYPLVFNTKGFNIPEDINTRMIPLLLHQLPPETRAQSLDPQLGVRLRLAAYAMARELNLSIRTGELGLKGMRFKRHAYIAALIYMARTDKTMEEAAVAIDKAGLAMQEKLRWHVAKASDSDMLAEQDRGESLLVRWADFQPAVTPVVAQAMVGILSAGAGGGRFSTGSLLRAFGAANDVTGSARTILERLLGIRIDGADRAIGYALSLDLEHRMPTVDAMIPLGDDACTLAGYMLKRTVDSSSGGRQFKIIKQNV
jgi:hypothetical protein